MLEWSQKKIDEVDLSGLKKTCHPDNHTDWDAPYYRGLASLSMQLESKHFLDCGTRYGYSAMCLGMNPSNQVDTYDLWDWGQRDFYATAENVCFHIGDALGLSNGKYLEATVIFLDVDPHNGITEFGFYRHLIRIGFKGVLLCDDIWEPENMHRIFWDYVKHEKIEVPEEIGHGTGFGVINFIPGLLEVKCK